jgi:hypothetical protein
LVLTLARGRISGKSPVMTRLAMQMMLGQRLTKPKKQNLIFNLKKKGILCKRNHS